MLSKALCSKNRAFKSVEVEIIKPIGGRFRDVEFDVYYWWLVHEPDHFTS